MTVTSKPVDDQHSTLPYKPSTWLQSVHFKLDLSHRQYSNMHWRMATLHWHSSPNPTT